MFLLIFIQLVTSSDAVPSLSSLSIKSLIPKIASGKIDLSTLSGFYVNDAEEGEEVLSAFLTKHILKYHFERFKQELESIHKLGILSLVLSEEEIDIMEPGGPRLNDVS